MPPPRSVLAKDLAPMPSASEPRLAFEAPILEMEARLSEMEVHYARNRFDGRPDQDRRADPPPASRAGRAEARNLFAPGSLAGRAGLAASESAPDPRLHRVALRAVRRAARRPRRRRRQGDRDRSGAPRRVQDDVHRPPEGQGPGRADRMPLRLRPSRRLSQGAGQDAAGGEVPPADRHVHRHPRGLSRASPPRSGARRP